MVCVRMFMKWFLIKDDNIIYFMCYKVIGEICFVINVKIIC